MKARHILIGAVTLVVATAGLLVGQSTVQRDTVIRDFLNGIKLNGSTTITGSGTAGNASLVLPTNSVGALEHGSTGVMAVFCGENAENGTIYQGPIAFTTPQPAIDATACDTLTNATETSADARLFAAGSATLRPMHMACITNGTLGASETLTITLRADAADVTAAGADFACAMAASETTCVEEDNADAVYAATTLWSMQVVQASNNADADDTLCVVWFQVN